MTLDQLISEHAPAPYTGDDSAAVLDEAIATLGTLRRRQHVGDPGAILHLLASLAADIDTLIPATIHAARDQDYTWTEIAGLANLSRDRVQRLSVILVVAALSEATVEQGEIREEACPLLPLR